MQGFGLLMVAWFVGLLVWRTVDRQAERGPAAPARGARAQLGELSHGLDHRCTIRGPGAAGGARSAGGRGGGGRGRRHRWSEEIHALTDQASPARRRRSASRARSASASGFVKALAVALLIRTIFIEPFRIPSGSMLPTLQIGDQIFVNKFIYGVRIPFANVVPVRHRPRARSAATSSSSTTPSTGQDYIKRVVGIPGDVHRVQGRRACTSTATWSRHSWRSPRSTPGTSNGRLALAPGAPRPVDRDGWRTRDHDILHDARARTRDRRRPERAHRGSARTRSS